LISGEDGGLGAEAAGASELFEGVG
jgi:hypothetical protein